MGVKVQDRIHFSLELKDRQALLVYHYVVKPLISPIIEIVVEEVSKHFEENLLEDLPYISRDKGRVKEWLRNVLTSKPTSGDISAIIEKEPKEKKEKRKKELDFDKVFGNILKGL